MPISPNSLINRAVSDRAGSSSSRASSVVLPEPRKPVINVTGVKSGSVSAKLTLHERDQSLIEWIAGPAEEALGGHPEMREIIDDLGFAGCGRQDERAALPVCEVHSVVFQNAVRRRHAMHSLAAARNHVGVASETPGRATASVQCSAPPRTPHNAHMTVLPFSQRVRGE